MHLQYCYQMFLPQYHRIQYRAIKFANVFPQTCANQKARNKGLEMLRGDNATCNGCLARREKRAGNNTERVKELSCNHAENKDTINEKKQCRLRWIVRCAGAM